MTQARAIIVALVVGFGTGFVVRPIIAPAEQADADTSLPPVIVAPVEPRGKQYFAAHLDEARQVMAQRAEGTVRGDECFNADMAVTEADGRARHKRFFGN